MERHVTLDKDTLNVTAELQKDVQYGTLTITADVDGAWVYINGEEYGVAPMQVNLPYGSYNVMLEKSGYQSYKQSIQIRPKRRQSMQRWNKDETASDKIRGGKRNGRLSCKISAMAG